MEMIERVARALCECDIRASGRSRSVEHEWKDFRYAAHVVIQAMREPTEAMLDHAATTNNCYDSGNYMAVWDFMIEAALKDTTAEPVYEWKAMSEWLEENPPIRPGKEGRRIPKDDGWEIVGGALRRLISNA